MTLYFFSRILNELFTLFLTGNYCYYVRKKMKKLLIMTMIMGGMAFAEEEKRFYTAKEGVSEAEANISVGKLYLLRYGIPSASAEIDKETGLTIETLGCEVWPGMEDYIQSYNKTIRRHILEKKGDKKLK